MWSEDFIVNGPYWGSGEANSYSSYSPGIPDGVGVVYN